MKPYNNQDIHCPFCNSMEIDVVMLEDSVLEGSAQLQFECSDCYGGWDITYQAVGVLNEYKGIDTNG